LLRLRHIWNGFVLEFLPGRPFAAAARKKDKTATVFDVTSGSPQLTIDTSIEIYGLRATESTIVVIGDEKVVTWNLPGGNFLPDAKMNIEDSTWTKNFRKADNSTVDTASISLDLRYIVLARRNATGKFLEVYDTSAGWNVLVEAGETISVLWFAPGERDIWCGY